MMRTVVGGDQVVGPQVARSTSDWTVRVVPELDRIEPRTWDALVGPDDLQATHRFVQVCEASGVEDARYRHILITDSVGPVALATLSAFPVHLDLLAPPSARRVTTVARRLFRLPLVVAGLPVSFNQSCLRVRPGADATAVLELLDHHARAFAAESDSRIVCFKEFAPAERDVVGSGLARLGYVHSFSLPSCVLDLPYRSMDEYLRAMRSGYRRQALATLKGREAAGLRARLAPLAPHVDRILPLYDQVIERAEHRMERLNRAFFTELAERLPEASALLLEDRGGELICAAVLLRGATKVTFLISGIDYPAARPVRGYEALMLAVVEQAIEWRATSIELGQTSLPLKTRFGARVEARHLFFRHLGRVGAALLPRVLPLAFPERRVPPRRVFRVPA
jgi:hypothetical protein